MWDKTDTKEALLQLWKPPDHIIKFIRHLDKHQKLCKSIGTPVRDTEKILLFVVQMYTNKHLTK